MLLHNYLTYSYRKLISCSEDGSVRMWELHEKQHLTAEPVPSGLYTKKIELIA